MKKKFYIIPGWGNSLNEKPYKELALIAKNKGYTVIGINPKWKGAFLPQIFPISKNDTIFGFSLGAVLAYMVAQHSSHKKAIIASMSPIKDLSDDILKTFGKRKFPEFKNFEFGGVNAIFFAGDQEAPQIISRTKKMKGLIIKDNHHELTPNYIKAISRFL